MAAVGELLGSIRLMKGTGLAVAIAVCAMTIGIDLSAELSCVVVTVEGADPKFEQNLRSLLKSELTCPVVQTSDETRSCRPLIIVIAENKAHIRLEGGDTLETEMRLEGTPKSHWERAIALSCAGLLGLAADPPPSDSTPSGAGDVQEEEDATDRAVREKPDEEAPIEASSVLSYPISESLEKAKEPEAPTPPAEENPKEPKPNESPNQVEKEASDTKPPKRTVPTEKETPSHQVLIGGEVGGRLIAKYPAWITDIALGVGVGRKDFQLTLRGAGVWGRRSDAAGKIFTGGVGAKVTGWWRFWRRRHVGLALGPTVEYLAVWGYGQGKNGFIATEGFGHVLTLCLNLRGSFVRTPRIVAHLTLSGGWSPVSLDFKAGTESVSGLQGGVVSLNVGIDFGLESQ